MKKKISNITIEYEPSEFLEDFTIEGETALGDDFVIYLTKEQAKELADFINTVE